jgi:hypothetical protein
MRRTIGRPPLPRTGSSSGSAAAAEIGRRRIKILIFSLTCLYELFTDFLLSATKETVHSEMINTLTVHTVENLKEKKNLISKVCADPRLL